MRKGDRMSKKYYWLKLRDGFFDTKPLKKLRKIAGGDTYTIIYLKLQLLSLSGEGMLFYEGVEDDFIEELALAIDEDVDNVKFTVLFLEKCGLLEWTSDSEIMLTAVPYAIGKETDSARRVREHRQRKALQCNTDVTSGNTEIEKEKDIETEIEKDTRERIDYQRIAAMYNDTCVSFPRLKSLSDTRKKAIKARFKTYTYEDFQTLFTKAEASDFLKGKNGRDWQANFDWLIKDANMAKVLDGNYDNKASNGRKEPIPKWLPKEQNDYDFDELEKTLTSNLGNNPELRQRAEELKQKLAQ